MNTQSDTPVPPFIPTAQPVGFIHLGCLCVCVVNYYADDYSQKTRDYLPVQALMQWAEADWDSAQAALQTEKARCLYGIREFLTPQISGMTTSKSAALYIRLDRSQRYLAHLCANHLAADKPTAPHLVQLQADWDQALAHYQHQSRALAWWQHCGLEEISEPGITERRQAQPKPTMIQELEMIHQLSGHSRYSQHNHSHSPRRHCRCTRSRSHTHGPF